MTIPFARLPTVPDQRPRFRLSVEKYEHMIATGTLGAEDRVELIDGELVEKMPIGDLHAECVDWFVERFVRTFAGRARVRIQNPALMPHSVPEPDVQLLKLRPAGYRSAKPTSADILLVVEVADSSVGYDLGTKARLYAAAGVLEYWVADLQNSVLHVHRGPQPDGSWETVQQFRPGQTLAPLAFPDDVLQVSEMLLA